MYDNKPFVNMFNRAQVNSNIIAVLSKYSGGDKKIYYTYITTAISFNSFLT